MAEMSALLASHVILLVICLASIFAPTCGGEDVFEDDRCRCICPSQAVVNGSKDSPRVHIKKVKPGDCNCENTVDPLPDPAHIKEFCPRCKCSFEMRNTTTIKIVVVCIICLVSLLVIYMLFLLCLDPLMNRRPRSYREHQNEDINLEAENDELLLDTDDPSIALPQASTSAFPSTPALGRARKPSNIVNRVKDTQEKWKGTVEVQRKHIYDEHSMLN